MRLAARLVIFVAGVFVAVGPGAFGNESRQGSLSITEPDPDRRDEARNVTDPAIQTDSHPSRIQVAAGSMRLGIQMIYSGADHLLFLFGFLLIVRDRWMLLKTMAAFTIAHSLTLASATLAHARPPAAPLNAAIGLSIAFLGLEILRLWRGEASQATHRLEVIAFLFGLLHGFGFAEAFGGVEMPRSLIGFNAGIEIAQASFILLVLGLHRFFRQLEIRWPLWMDAFPGYAVGSLGAFWTIQQTAAIFGMNIGMKR